MLKGLLSRRPSHATVVAYLALFVALGGTAYAANEWTGANIVDESLTGADVRGKNGTATTAAVNGSLTTFDIAGQKADAANGTPFVPGTLTQWDIRDNSIAAKDILANSIGTNRITDNSLTGTDIVDFSLSNEDVGVLFAQVNADGTIANSSGGVTGLRLGTGTYEVDFGRDISSCAFVSTQGEAGVGGAVGAITGVTDRSGNADAVFATTRTDANALADRALQLVVVC